MLIHRGLVLQVDLARRGRVVIVGSFAAQVVDLLSLLVEAVDALVRRRWHVLALFLILMLEVVLALVCLL